MQHVKGQNTQPTSAAQAPPSHLWVPCAAVCCPPAAATAPALSGAVVQPRLPATELLPLQTTRVVVHGAPAAAVAAVVVVVVVAIPGTPAAC